MYSSLFFLSLFFFSLVWYETLTSWLELMSLAGAGLSLPSCCKAIPGNVYRSEKQRYFFNRELCQGGAAVSFYEERAPSVTLRLRSTSRSELRLPEGPHPWEVLSHPRPGIATRAHRATAHPLQKPRACADPKQPGFPQPWDYPTASKSLRKPDKKTDRTLLLA